MVESGLEGPAQHPDGGAIDTTEATGPTQVDLGDHLINFLRKKGVKAKVLTDLRPVQPPSPLDTSRPLADYFCSSSHNTYLTAHQLVGKSEAEQYLRVLQRGARCVEIDCWDGEDGEPIVYHGFTLTKKIPFADVVKAIGAAIGPTDLPVVVSFECHVSIEQQKRVVEIVKDMWKGKLIDAPVKGVDSMITLENARGKILLKVEYCRGFFPFLDESLATESRSVEEGQSSSESDEENKAAESNEDPAAMALRKQRKAIPKQRMCRELAELGVYTTSLKPTGDDFLRTDPKRHFSLVANVSESSLATHIARAMPQVIHHNAHQLMRVYPKGVRFNSKNLSPIAYWTVGSQITALNFQKWDRGMQLNEAFFTGTGGWQLKPEYLRIEEGRESTPGLPKPIKSRLDLEIVGAHNLIRPDDAKKGLNAYIEVELCQAKDSERKRTKTVKYKSGDPALGSDPIFDETISFSMNREYFTFLRLLFNHDDSFYSRDDRFATYCIFLPYVQPGYHAARLYDLSGTLTESVVVFRVEVKDV